MDTAALGTVAGNGQYLREIGRAAGGHDQLVAHLPERIAALRALR